MEEVLVLVVNRKQGNQSVSENPSTPCSTLLHAKRKKHSPQLVDLQTKIAKDTTDPTVEALEIGAIIKKMMRREVNISIRAAADSNVTRVQKSEVLFVQLAELKRGLNIHGRRCTLIAP